MSRFKSGIFIIILFLSLSMGATAFAETSFQFAPSRNKAQVAQAPSASSSNELSLLIDLESKVIEKIPKPIKDGFNVFDAKRAEQAKKYEDLRDTAYEKTIVVKKANAVKADDTAAESTPKTGYYIYVVLAVFFGYQYIFYGAILVAIFLLGRIILRYFNVIV